MCKKVRSTISITIRDENGREYSLDNSLLIHWAKRLEPKHEEIMEATMGDIMRRLVTEAEGEIDFNQDFFFDDLDYRPE